MMEQLWYTWSTVGLGSVTGFRVRAASDGLMDLNNERFRSFRGHLNYYLPQGTDPYTATTDTSPVCLAFIDPNNEGLKDPNDQRNPHIVLQKVYTGKDAYGRAGAYFVHLLDLQAEMPEDFVASDAIELWDSAFWQRSDTLPLDVVRLKRIDRSALSPGPLRERDMKEIETDLPWLIQAFLSLKPHQKLYIVAPPPRVAALIWGLTHSLPHPLQKKQKLTFSTYEQDVTRASVRVVGTCKATIIQQNAYVGQQSLLPADSLSGQGLALALDCYTGQRSPLELGTVEAEYARFATQRLVNGPKPELDNLLNAANAMKVENTDSLMVVFKIHIRAQQNDLTQEDTNIILKDANLASGLLMEEAVQRNIIDLCIKNPNWWQGEAEPAIKQLPSKFDTPAEKRLRAALSSLATQAATYYCTALFHNDDATSNATMKILFAAAPPNRDSAPWVHLLHRFSELISRERTFDLASVFSWDRRICLLQQWGYSADSIDDKHILPWLQMGWTDLSKLLELREKLPAGWRQMAIAEAITNLKHTPGQKYAQYLMTNFSTLFEGALRWLMYNPRTQPLVLNFCISVMKNGYKDRLQLVLILISVQTPNRVDLNTLLLAAELNKNPKDYISLLEQHGVSLLSHRITPAITDIIWLYIYHIGHLGLDKLGDAHIRNTLYLLYQHVEELPDELATNVQNWFFVSEGVPLPEWRLKMEKKHLQKMGIAIQELQLPGRKKFKEYRYNLLLILINNIMDERQLYFVLECFVPALSSSQIRLFQDLTTFMGEEYNPKEVSYKWLMPYILVILEQARKKPTAENKSQFLDLLPSLLHRADDKTFDQIDAEVRTWSDALPLQEDWVIYSRDLRPKGFDLNFKKRFLPSRPAQDQSQAPSIQEQQDLPPKREQEPFMQHEREPLMSAIPYDQEQRLAKKQEMQQESLSRSQQFLLPGQGRDEQRKQLHSPQPAATISTVMGIPIMSDQLEKVYALKIVYINWRLPQLRKQLPELSKKRFDTQWANDELDELQNHQTLQDTLRVLQNDIIIDYALNQYGISAKNVLNTIFSEVYDAVKKLPDCKKALDAGYNLSDIETMLLVFVRYRALDLYFRQQGDPTIMKEWLQIRRQSTKIEPENQYR